MFYYAKLNENQICTEILTRAKELPQDLDGYVKIPDYNETLLWRKWDGTQWSEERYEPSIEAELQERVGELETQNNTLTQEISNLRSTNESLLQSIAELTTIIATLEAPTE